MIAPPVKFRHWLAHVFVIGAALFAAAMIFGFFLFKNPPKDRRELQRIRMVANLVVQNGYHLPSPPDTNTLKDDLAKIDQDTRLRIAIYDQSGLLLADSRWNSASPLPTWDYFAGRDPETPPRYTDAVGQEWLIAYLPFEDDSIVFVASQRPVTKFQDILRDESMILFLRAAFIAFMAVSIFTLLIFRWTDR